MNALDTQVGGDHYKKMPIQPMQYSMANGLDACQHSVVKYITRFRDKGGIADLEKAKHVIDMLIQFERDKAKPDPAPVPANDNSNERDHVRRKQDAMNSGAYKVRFTNQPCGNCRMEGRVSCKAVEK